MLKNTIKKRIFLIISSLFVIFIIYLFPTQKEEIITKENKKNNYNYIYLLDKDNYVARVSVILNNKEAIKQIEEVIEYLTIGSNKSNYIKEGFTPIIPKNTKILSIDIDKNIVKINFSQEFLNIAEDKIEALISSIVYSITSLNNNYKLTIYVDGNLLNKLGNINIPTVIDRLFGINNNYSVDKINGITQTTVYFLSKYNDYYYYVPITYVNNKTDDKIKIIIEQMASKSIYQTSLISYLKDIKKMNYEIQNDSIILNLSSINFSSKNMIEEVLYTFNLSIKDNYNIKEVIYYIDNELYKKCQI